MTYYFRSGTTFKVTTGEALDLHEKLPVGTYAVEQDPMSGQFYLDRIRDLEVKGKVYGDANTLTDRILNTFWNRPDSTGVLLTGEKGSGKTLQAKLLSVKARDNMGIPTIVVNRPYRGDGFNKFMQVIDQPVVVIFDEFEKVYSREEQEGMLTLLDGIYPSKKLFVLTCNDKYRINDQMKNRPGRLFYRIEYSGIEDDFIREFAADNLNDASDERIDGIVTIASVFNSFNFDMLAALVQEMNRYGEDAKSANRYLNARPDDEDLNMNYSVELWIGGQQILPPHLITTTWIGSPIDEDLFMNVVYYDPAQPLPQPDDGIAAKATRRKNTMFVGGALRNVSVERGSGPVFKLVNEEDDAVVYLRRHRPAPVYSPLF